MFDTIIPGTDHDTPSDSTAAVKSVSIDNLLNIRQAISDRVTEAAKLLNEATKLASANHFGLPRIEFHHHRHNGDMTSLDAAEKLMKQVDATGWQYLMNESGLKSFMDSQARSEWSTKCYELEVPELTRENIAATFASLHASRGDMLDRGVIRVFKGLSWDYKSHNPVKFGPRLIINRLLGTWGPNGKYFSFGTEANNRLDDLDRVFHKLANLPEPDHRDAWHVRLDAAHRKGETVASSPFMTVKFFKKGSGHVTFSRPELVDELNRILMKHYPDALPAAR